MPAEGGRAGAALTGVLIGLLIGAMLALSVANNQRYRNIYPRGLMAVMQADLDHIAEAAAANRCEDLANRERLTRLLSLSLDSRSAFRAEQNEHFGKLDLALQQSLQHAIASPDCSTLATRLVDVDRQCEACHREYR